MSKSWFDYARMFTKRLFSTANGNESRPRRAARTRLSLEGLEERTLLSAASVEPPIQAPLLEVREASGSGIPELRFPLHSGHYAASNFPGCVSGAVDDRETRATVPARALHRGIDGVADGCTIRAAHLVLSHRRISNGTTLLAESKSSYGAGSLRFHLWRRIRRYA
jgi:hypothetical protein